MVEASNTTVGPADIWAIVIVMVLLLAFWLSAIALADRSQVRASGRARLGQGRTGLVGAWTGGSVPGVQDPEIADEPFHEPIENRDQPDRPAAGQHEVPRQRSGDADRAARSHAGPAPPDEAGPGR
jgi:hypothetical protein